MCGIQVSERKCYKPPTMSLKSIHILATVVDPAYARRCVSAPFIHMQPRQAYIDLNGFRCGGPMASWCRMRCGVDASRRLRLYKPPCSPCGSGSLPSIERKMRPRMRPRIHILRIMEPVPVRLRRRILAVCASPIKMCCCSYTHLRVECRGSCAYHNAE